jgi:F-type H+-transporting ATPase subunit epsilon
MATFPFTLVTPEQVVLSEEAEMVTLRAEGGDIAYLADHVPFIGEVEPTVATAHLPGGERKEVAVDGGFVEVGQDGETVLLATQAVLPGQVDHAQAGRDRDEAVARAAERPGDLEAKREVQWAEARLALAGGAL